jgi:AraC-like DNA-binding protein
MWRTTELGGVELLKATIREFSFVPHAHEEYFIALTESGVVTPTYRGNRHVIGPSELIVLNPEEAHAGGPPDGVAWTYRALYVRPDGMRDVMAEFAQRRALPQFGDVVRDQQVTACLRRFHRLAESSESSALHRQAQLVEALVLLVGRHGVAPQASRTPGCERRAVRVSKQYLEEHVAENVTLDELARHAGLSPYHLCRVFRQAVGMTLHAYQTQSRVRRAKALLRAGVPITRVAAETGFCDQAHLTRHFKRIVGLPPGRYVAN